jgi:hypothetical protein
MISITEEVRRCPTITGVDSHLVVQDNSGRTLRSGRVKNDRHSLSAFLNRYRDNSHAVVEATMVIYDWLTTFATRSCLRTR